MFSFLQKKYNSDSLCTRCDGDCDQCVLGARSTTTSRTSVLLFLAYCSRRTQAAVLQLSITQAAWLKPCTSAHAIRCAHIASHASICCTSGVSYRRLSVFCVRCSHWCAVYVSAGVCLISEASAPFSSMFLPQCQYAKQKPEYM